MSAESNASAFTAFGISQPDISTVLLEYHPKFQRTDSTDVTFRSSDGILFCLHRKNIETHSDAFPGPEISVDGEEVPNLTEPSEVLAIIFDFMYPRRQADIEKMDYNIVAQVAEAVEKYQIFSAMQTCILRLKQLVSTHAAEVMAHGIKHDYPSLVNEALPFLARRPLVEVLKRLPSQYYLPWCQYRHAWDQVFRDLIQETARNSGGSSLPNNYLGGVISQILEWEKMDLSTLQTTLDEKANRPDSCNNCRNREVYTSSGNDLQTYLQRTAITCRTKIQGIPSFSGF